MANLNSGRPRLAANGTSRVFSGLKQNPIFVIL